MDFEQLKFKIVRAGERAFNRVKADHPDHSFYQFGLYTTHMYEYLLPTCSSHEGLTEVIDKHKESERIRTDYSIDEITALLKWSPCDSPLHLYADDEFISIQDDMELIFETIEELSDDLEMEEQFIDQVEQCLIDSLIELDKRGVFGNEEERKSIVVNILIGDQAMRDRLFTGSKLNSIEQLDAFRLDCELLERTQDFLFVNSSHIWFLHYTRSLLSRLLRSFISNERHIRSFTY